MELIFYYLNKACLKMKETNPNYHIPEKIIIYILKQMLEILYFLYIKYNIIHRDIKPNNILIDKHYKVKLIDIGLATYLIGDNNNNLVAKNSYKDFYNNNNLVIIYQKIILNQILNI